jgi:hypothetical protein
LCHCALYSDLLSELLRQGCYSDEGDIVVLCAYLGQLSRLRDALAGDVAIIIDERDQAALADQEGDEAEGFGADVAIEHVKITKRVTSYVVLCRHFVLSISQVRLRTVDNYQGEEGRVSFPLCTEDSLLRVVNFPDRDSLAC